MTRLGHQITLVIAACTGLLGLLFALGLPSLGALPDARLWTRALYALPAGILAWILLQQRLSSSTTRPNATHDPSARLLYLPPVLAFAFTIAGGLTTPLISFIVDDPFFSRRPEVLLIGAPALTLATALLLHVWTRRIFVREVHRLLADASRPLVAIPPGWRGERPMSLRRALFLATVALATVALTLTAVHIRSQLQTLEAQQRHRHLTTLADVCRVHLSHLSPTQRVAYIQTFPSSAFVVPVLVSSRGRVIASAGLIPVKRQLHVTSGRCGHRNDTWPCIIHRLDAHQALALLSRPAPHHVGRGSAMLGGGLFLLAALLGLVISRDLSRDIDHVTHQLQEMATADRVDLSHAIPVASLDEIGELIEAVGALRARLAVDLESYTSSLDRARHVKEANDAFLADVSHELHTPLRDLADRTQDLIGGAFGDLSPAQREDLEVIYKSSQQLFGLINDVLDMSILETGTLRLSLEEVNLGDLCRQAFEQQEALVRSGRVNKIHLELIIDDELPRLRADARRILQIIQNLLSNAVKFTRRGDVWLRATTVDDDHLMIEVEDTGPGISLADQQRIFDEYRQAGSARARQGGTGLGLAICKRLVALHDGDLDLESELGSGSCFRVTLPIAGPKGEAS